MNAFCILCGLYSESKQTNLNLNSPVSELDSTSLPEREASQQQFQMKQLSFVWPMFFIPGLHFLVSRLKGGKIVAVWRCGGEEPKQLSFNCLDQIQPSSRSPTPSRAEFGTIRHCSTAGGVDFSCLEFGKQAVSCAFFTLLLIKNLTF